MVINYLLEAEFTPIQNCDYETEKFEHMHTFNRKPEPRILSTFRTSIEISIFKPVLQPPPVLFQVGL